MLQAMNTGHDGSLCTVHANSPRDALARIETMVLMAGYDLPVRAIRQQVAVGARPDRPPRAPRGRLPPRHGDHRGAADGVRGDHAPGHLRVQGRARSRADRTSSAASQPTGLRPSFLHKFEKRGVELPVSLFARRARRRATSRDGSGAGETTDARRCSSRAAARRCRVGGRRRRRGRRAHGSRSPARRRVPGPRVPPHAPDETGAATEARSRARERRARRATSRRARREARDAVRRRPRRSTRATSMRGEPIVNAMEAARAFAAQRSPNQQLAIVIASTSDTSVVLPFTADQAEIDAALARAPGARVRHAHVRRGRRGDRAARGRPASSVGSVVLLSDGADTGSVGSSRTRVAERRRDGARAHLLGRASLAALRLRPRSELRGRRRRATYAEARRRDELTRDLRRARAPARERVPHPLPLGVAAPAQRSTSPSGSTGVDGVATSAYTSPELRSDGAPRVPYAVLRRALLALAVAGLAWSRSSALSRPARRGRAHRARPRSTPNAPAADGGVRLGLPVEEERGASATTYGRRSRPRPRGRSSARSGGRGSRRSSRSAGITVAPVQIVALDRRRAPLASCGSGVLLPRAGSCRSCSLSLASPSSSALSIKRKRRAREAPLRRAAAGQPRRCSRRRCAPGTASSARSPSSSRIAPEPSRSRVPPRRSPTSSWASRSRRRSASSCGGWTNTDLEQVALVAALQRETGGNTAEVLDRVSETIRGRFELRRLVRTLTAQGRMSRWVVSLLPVGLLVADHLHQPGVHGAALPHAARAVLLVIAALMVISGSLVIKRIVDIKV